VLGDGKVNGMPGMRFTGWDTREDTEVVAIAGSLESSWWNGGSIWDLHAGEDIEITSTPVCAV